MFTAGALLAAGVAATLLAGRLRVPGLVLFLALGMLIGSDGLGWIDFGHSRADVELTRTLGVIALALILFEGGLAAGWGEIRPVLGPGLALATVGTFVTAAVTGLAAHLLLGVDLLHGLLLGSVVATTDTAAVFSVLRGSSLRRRLARTLEAEAGFNDPLAILLVIGFTQWIVTPGYGTGDMVALLARQLAVGGVVGLIVGVAAVSALSKLRLASLGLYPVGSMATCGLAFGAADLLHGSGFLSVYLAGLALGTASIPAKRTIEAFHAGVAWVSQIALFLLLGLLVFPSQLGPVARDALLLTAVLVLVARPLATFVCTLPARYSPREGLLLGWAGLRGALPVVFATFPVLEGVAGAGRFFNIVFFAVLVSALVQGVTFEPLARALGLTSREPARPRPLVEVGTIRRLGAEVLEFPVAPEDAAVGRLVRELGLPRDALVSVIVRGDQALLPRGSTEIAAGDRLHILVRRDHRRVVEELFERWRRGPVGDPAPPPRAPLLGRAAIFSVKPWQPEWGDPGAPEMVDGIPVARVLRTRHGAPGALVELADGRLAATGEGRVAVGGPRQLLRYARERIRQAADEQSRSWWQEVAGVASQSAVV